MSGILQVNKKLKALLFFSRNKRSPSNDSLWIIALNPLNKEKEAAVRMRKERSKRKIDTRIKIHSETGGVAKRLDCTQQQINKHKTIPLKISRYWLLRKQFISEGIWQTTTQLEQQLNPWIYHFLALCYLTWFNETFQE